MLPIFLLRTYFRQIDFLNVCVCSQGENAAKIFLQGFFGDNSIFGILRVAKQGGEMLPVFLFGPNFFADKSIF